MADERHHPQTQPASQIDALRCPVCDYRLHGLSGEHCPECGWRIEAEVVEALAVRRERFGVGPQRNMVLIAALSAAVATVLLGGYLFTQSLRSGPSAFAVLAALGAILAVVGLLRLAWITMAQGALWPLSPRLGRPTLRMLALVSVAFGFLGATRRCGFAPGTSPLDAEGLEFVAQVVLQILPGLMLAVLTAVAFYTLPEIEAAAREVSAGDAPALEGSPFLVQAFGVFDPSHVEISMGGAPRREYPIVEEWIEKTWQERLADARTHGRVLFNGRLARLSTGRREGNILRLELAQTTYREFLGTNMYHAAKIIELGVDGLSDALGISSTPITSDGFVVYGRRNRSVSFHRGFLHTFGGALEDADQSPSADYDIFAAATRELCEELLIQPSEIKSLICVGLVRDREMLQPELLFDAVLAVPLKELLRRFDPRAEGQEHSALEYIWDVPHEAAQWPIRARPIAPICQAALYLHGRRLWGESWYETTCLLQYGESPPELKP